MKDLEKQIEEASEQNYAKLLPLESISDRYKGFIEGAKSEAAKQYWQQGMYSEEEVGELLEQAIGAFQSITRNRTSWSFDIREWVEEHKKK